MFVVRCRVGVGLLLSRSISVFIVVGSSLRMVSFVMRAMVCSLFLIRVISVGIIVLLLWDIRVSVVVVRMVVLLLVRSCINVCCELVEKCWFSVLVVRWCIVGFGSLVVSMSSGVVFLGSILFRVVNAVFRMELRLCGVWVMIWF